MNTSNRVGDALEALRTRLLTIKETAGYGISVKTVRVNEAQPTLNVAEKELPLIEIVDEAETYDHSGSSTYIAKMGVVLYAVAPKGWTDFQMQRFLADMRRAIYGGTADASGNTGITLGGKVEKILLLNSAGDLNMLDSCRVYMLRIQLHQQRTTYRD